MLPVPISIRYGARYVYTNPTFARILGYDDPQELIGLRVIDTIHPDDQTRLVERLKRVDGGRPMLTWSELKFAAKDGSPVPLEVSPSISVVYREQSCWLVAAHDRRENKRLEAALAVGERMATVGTLAAGVGHEINNPLAYVTMNLELAAHEIEKLAAELPSGRTRELQRMIAEARDGAGRITKIVRGMNTFARGNRDEPAPLDLHAVLETALSLTHHELRQSTQVVKQLAPVPAVFADETRVVQVLVNLLLNAVQAMHDRLADRNVITISTRQDAQGRAVLEIADNGPGMDDSVAARIFEPFFTTKPVGIGTGLGLSIAHNNVLAVGGTLACETAPGRGALFRMTLPPCAEDSTSPSAHSGADLRAVRRGRVLLVDDEPNVALSLARMMADEHDVAISGSGQEALAAIDANPTYDLVLCDIMMPNMNGMELFETVRAKHPELAQRFVFMTGGVTNERTQAFLEEVTNERLEKPFPLGKLLSLVRRAVAGSPEAR
jgi:PAS domain S-box-containing protein